MKYYWILLFLILVTSVYAFESSDQIVINSNDWTDIYSGMLYAGIKGEKASYLIEETRGYLLLDTIGQSGEKILLFESPSMPIIKNYATDLESKGFEVEVFKDYDNLNIELAQDLDTKSYIIMDPRYSYNAISLAPYAVLKKSYVLFANSDNIDDIVSLLEEKKPEKLMIYGYVDREVAEKLKGFNPEILNKGNKYDNNLEIVKRFGKDKSFSQYLLTSGAFIEPQFFEPINPVLFVGNTKIPDSTLEFLQKSEVKHAIMIGNDLFALGTQLKQNANMKIMIKFAKGINKVQYSLDIFPLPAFVFIPVFDEFSYNQLSKQLIVAISNKGTSPMFGRATYTILINNESIAELGDEQSFFIDEDSSTTRTYDIDLNNYADENIKIRALLSYGEEIGSLDSLLVEEKNLSFVQFEDKSSIEITDVYFDSQIKRFIIIIKNTGNEPVYVLPTIKDVILNNKKVNLAGEKVLIEPNKKQKIKIKARLSPEDIEDNKILTLVAEYGANENRLIKRITHKTEFKLKSYTDLYIITGALVILLILILLIYKKKKIKHKKAYHHKKVYHIPPAPHKNQTNQSKFQKTYNHTKKNYEFYHRKI